MEESNPIRDEEGNIPFVSTNVSGEWIGWFGINADTIRIPTEAEFFVSYDIDCRDENLEPRTPSGRFEDMDWAVDPDWYRYTTHWRGWIPVKDLEGEFQTPQFLDLDEPSPCFENVQGMWYVPRPYATDLAFRWEELDKIVERCSSIRMGNVQCTVLRPPSAQNHSLEATPFDTEPELQKATMAVRRAIADRLGWLFWFRAAIPQPILQEILPLATMNQLLQETGTEYRKRGYILGLVDCWTEANLPLWLTHRIPLLYRWRFDECGMRRLARMNPKLVAGDTSDGRIQIHYIEEDEHLRRAAADSLLYDDYFQLNDPVVVNQDLSFEMDAILYVIDFEGWGRRPLAAGTHFGVYSERFFFKTENGAGNSLVSAPNVVFWRWRKKTIPITRRLEAVPRGEMDESFIREVYKDTYAPRLGRSYDVETGLPLEGGEAEADLPRVEPFPDHRRDPSHTYPEDEITYTLSSGDSMPDLEEGESPSLMERLGLRTSPQPLDLAPYSSVANVTSWRNAARTREGRRNRYEPRLVRDNARLRSSRSRSPRRPLARNVFPDDRPLFVFREKLREIAHYIVHEEQRDSLTATLEWNPSLLTKGYIRIPEERCEVRFRYFANNPALGIHHIGPLLKMAITRRLGFQIAIKETDIPFFAPRAVSHANRVLGNSIYGPDFVEQPFKPASPAIFAANYVVRVGELLKRPHAPSFVGMGGAASWLAHRWGGDELVSRFMRGPSIQTTVFRRGASDINQLRPKGLVWDQPTAREVDLLFGYVPDPVHNSCENDRWLYPPPQIIDEFCDNWSGEWNWVMDKIYTFITNEILKNPCTISPRSRGAWKKWLRTYNGGSYTPTNVLTEHHVADIMKGLRLANLTPTWHERPLSSIYLPESTRD